MLDVKIGSSQRLEGLTLFPLLAPAGARLPYELLAEAVAAGTLAIGEVGEGTVPALLAKNAGAADVLVLDGEQLIGSRQNRTTNRSIVLPAHSQTELPVYCMEHGRWHFASDAMAPAPQHSPAKVRRRAREVEAARAAAGSIPMTMLREAQGDVWNDVAETVAKVGGASATGDLNAAYEANRSRLADWEQAFPRQDGQVGFLAFAGQQPLGLDLIGCHRLYERLHERLLRGYIMDALEHASDVPAAGARSARRPRASAGAAAAYLDAVRHAERTPAPTTGKGQYCVLRGLVIGGELTEADRLVHLSAFPAVRNPEPTRPPGAPLAPPSWRRRR
ncbi:MAG: hypothetical protein FIB01_00585 [Gemmatimonadetes bacterium]|nr:hypothetical protein [Gemmatimonadota bacterium]